MKKKKTKKNKNKNKNKRNKKKKVLQVRSLGRVVEEGGIKEGHKDC